MSGTILVTGGAGYVGSHACKALAQAGMTPVTYDNLERGNRWAVKWGPLEEGDIRDADRLNEVFQKHNPVAVMHFAAYGYVGESVQDPALYFNNNITGSLSLLDAARRFDVSRIIFSSTCATYGLPLQAEIDETHPQTPINPYGASKLMVERALQDYGQAYGLKYAILRYFNAAGADPDGEIGELHSPETHLIPLALTAAMGSEGPLMILGGDYDTDDGTCIRDFIHVRDLATAHVAALNHLLADKESISLNLGTGKGTSVKDIVSAIQDVCKLSVPTTVKPRRAGDPPVLVASAARAKSVLGWEPKHSEIREIIETAYAWEKRKSDGPL